MGIAAIFIIIISVAADRLTKYLAVEYLKPIGTIPIIKGAFSLTYVENSGAAFGLFQGGRWFFIIITVLILSFMIIYYSKLPHKKPYNYVKLCILLVVAGAIGNFIDRILRGYVVDFLHFTLIDFPVFNLADCFVCVGAFALAFLMAFVIKDEK